ncbi:MAG: pyridoxamine 5'-phosphate oxidase family protein [Chloroflexota bacterium]
MSTFEKTKRNTVIRAHTRGDYDKDSVYAIVDASLICHVGFVQNDQPFVIPTIHAREDDTILLHGATTSRLIKHVQAGHEVCITVTHLDGLVLARSVMHHSMNYRSAVIFGRGHLVSDEDTLRCMEVFTEKLIPGRWADCRPPNAKELKATSIVAIPIESASAKIRVGPPIDDEEDYELPYWAGVVPIQQKLTTPINDTRLNGGIEIPDYVGDYIETWGQ